MQILINYIRLRLIYNLFAHSPLYHRCRHRGRLYRHRRRRDGKCRVCTNNVCSLTFELALGEDYYYWCGGEFFLLFLEIFLIAVVNNNFGFGSRTFANKVATSLVVELRGDVSGQIPILLAKQNSQISWNNNDRKFRYSFFRFFCCSNPKKTNRFPRTKSIASARNGIFPRILKLLEFMKNNFDVGVVVLFKLLLWCWKLYVIHGAAQQRLRLHAIWNYSIFGFDQSGKWCTMHARKLMYVSKWNFRLSLCAFGFFSASLFVPWHLHTTLAHMRSHSHNSLLKLYTFHSFFAERKMPNE